MKRALFLAILVVFSANLAFAQAGAINLFSDPSGTSCDLFPVAGTLFFVYAVHVLAPGVTASQWAAPIPACAGPNTIFLSDQAVFPVTLGSSQTGVAIGYGACFGSPLHILTIQTLVLAPIPTCCLWHVTGDPNSVSGQIEVVDCANQLHVVPNMPSAVINPDGLCDCDEPLPTESSTWGGIKALYSE